MKGLRYMSNNNQEAIGKGNVTANPTQEELRNSMLNSVVEELISDKEKFFHFARVVRNEIPWEQIREEYESLLPSSLFMLEGMWPIKDPNSIISDIQQALQELGCEKIATHAMYTPYGLKEVMFGRIFPTTEEVTERNLEAAGFDKRLIPAAKKLLIIAKLFDTVDKWPNTKHCDDNVKLQIVTTMVNMLTTF